MTNIDGGKYVTLDLNGWGIKLIVAPSVNGDCWVLIVVLDVYVLMAPPEVYGSARGAYKALEDWRDMINGARTGGLTAWDLRAKIHQHDSIPF